MKILFMSVLFSPFQVELAAAVNRLTKNRCVVHFSHALRSERRQNHWANFALPGAEAFTITQRESRGGATLRKTLMELIERAKPDVVLTGAPVGDTYHAVVQSCRTHKIPYGLWLEKPRTGRGLARSVKQQLGYQLRLPRADFVLGIGPSAAKYFSRYHPRVASLVYCQDLSACREHTRLRKANTPLGFLFSGQLLQRHNIGEILDAARLVLQETSDFRLVFSGHGAEEASIDAALRADPKLKQVLAFDRDFVRWEDRLRPFFTNDILLYPSDYSGWGLVVPEALASGMPVISTLKVEAARYFVHPGRNGALVNSSPASIAAAMLKYIDSPQLLEAQSAEARHSALKGDVKVVALELVETIQRLLGIV